MAPSIISLPQALRASVLLLPSLSHALPQAAPATNSSDGSHIAKLGYEVSMAQQPTVDVKINGVTRRLLVDSGSPDTFVYSQGIKCIAADGVTEKPTEDCFFGDLYTGPIDRIDNLVFNQTYGTNQNLGGPFGYATVELAGVTLEKQRVAFVDRATNNTFRGAQGILGMAPGGDIEAAWTGSASNTVKLSGETQFKYPTVFETMYNVTKKVQPFWSFALDRATSSGSIGFGSSVPQAKNVSTWAHTPLISIGFAGIDSIENYYTIKPDGFELNGVRTNTTYPVAVDTGTFISRLPEELAEKFNAAFDPPAKLDPTGTIYTTTCDAKTPDFGLVIGGHLFKPRAEDMLQGTPLDPFTCITAITKPFPFDKKTFPEGFQVIGDLFFNGVVTEFETEFDVGKKEMRFGDLTEKPNSTQPNGTATMAPTSATPTATSAPATSTPATSGAERLATMQYLAAFAPIAMLFLTL